MTSLGKKPLIIIIGVVLIIAVYFYTKSPKFVDVEIVTLEQGEVRAMVSNTRVDTVKACRRAYLAPQQAGIAVKERKQRVIEALASVSLQDRGHHRPDQLSGGQLQRVAIARAMIMRPEILLADEPTGNLDSKSGKEIIELLDGLNWQGVTLMIITHDQNLGDRARRKIRIIDGQIV